MRRDAQPSDRTLERYLAGGCSPEERAEVAAWLATDPQRSMVLDELRRAVASDAGSGGWDTAGAWARLKQRIEMAAPSAQSVKRERPPRARRAQSDAPRAWLATHRRAAAIMLAAFGLSAAGVAYRARAGAMTTVATRAGEQKAIHLVDGSLVRLGPASTLRYRVTDRARTLELEGLADFAVAHDVSRPFLVRAGNTTTTDLGTEFVVRAFRGAMVDVEVASGRVELSAPESTITIGAGEAARVGLDGTIRRHAAAGDASGWLWGRLAFHEASVAEVAAELSRWYDVDVSVADSALARRRVTATYSAPTLRGVLDGLTASLGARYEQRGRAVIVRSR